jgi:alpha-1,3-rhamnosyl/mannosyltransferase
VSQPHRIGVNLLWLVPGVVGGSEEYTTRLLAGLGQRAHRDIEFVLFVLEPFVEAHRDLTERFETVVCPVLQGGVKSLRVGAENVWLYQQCFRHRIDLMHHAGGIMPAARSTPGVLTIHDLQPLIIPERFTPVKRNFSRLSIPPSARSAKLIFTPSEHARQTVVDLLDIEPDRVTVIPSAVAPRSGAPRPRAAAAVCASYGIEGRFFLYPAITYPHKNHQMLIEAFAEVASVEPDVTLVLTGGRERMEESISESIRRLGIERRVKRLGRIPRRDLDALFIRATALTFPSLFEGFGVPVLEAMNLGCAVIATTATSVPEVVGDAGMLVAPTDQAGWTAAMKRILTDDALAERYRTAGRARAADFSWERSSSLLEAGLRRGLSLAAVVPA